MRSCMLVHYIRCRVQRELCFFEALCWKVIAGKFHHSSARLREAIGRTHSVRDCCSSGVGHLQDAELFWTRTLQCVRLDSIIRRVMGKTIPPCITNDIFEVAGNSQLCVGQSCGIKHAIQELGKRFERSEGLSLHLTYSIVLTG